MQILSAVATLTFVIVGAAVGIRLLWLAGRTRELPETAIGAALLLIGGIGYPLAIAAGTPDVMTPEAGLRTLAFATFVIDMGFIGIVVFTWSVFRRQASWGRPLLAFFCIAYVAHAIANGFATADMQSPKDVMTSGSLATLGGQALNSLAFGWAAFEAYRYWWMLRKRAAIGLGDRVVTNRFLLWGLASTSSITTNLISWWLIVAKIDFFQHEGIQAAIGLVSVLACTCQYLAFLPPKAYLARLQAHDPA